MATNRQRNDFINFISDAAKNEKLAEEFLAQKTAKDLYSFFQKKEYKDIPENDCGDILAATKHMEGVCIPKPGEHPCGPTKGY